MSKRHRLRKRRRYWRRIDWARLVYRGGNWVLLPKGEIAPRWQLKALFRGGG